MHKKNVTTGFARMAVVLLLFMLIPAPTAFAGASLPVFASHPVKEQFKGTPAQPDLASAPGAKQFSTRIKEGASTGPNFAGHFTIVDWGCGTDCQSFVIVDAKTGAIYSPSITSSWGLLYKKDSSLLIVNPLIPDVMAGGPPPEWLISRYYTWDGKKLTQVAENRSTVIDPETGAAKPVEQRKESNVIECYNMTKSNDWERIKQVNGGWQARAEGGQVTLKVTDIANGYLEFVDENAMDGHGTTTTSVALFLTADRQPMLAVLAADYAPDVMQHPACPGREFRLKTFRWSAPDNAYDADDVMPVLPLSLFLKKGFAPRKDGVFEFPGMYLQVGYRLPRKGTTVEAFLNASGIACLAAVDDGRRPKKEIDEMKEFLQNVRKEPMKLKWNKAAGRFDPPAEQ